MAQTQISTRTAPSTLRAVAALQPLEQLRLALRLDAVASAAVGALAAAGAAALDRVLGISGPVLIGSGTALLGYAAVVWLVASRREVSRPAAWTIALGNLGYTAASLVVATTRPGSLTTAGAVLVAVQGLAVMVFAGLQLVAVRRCSARA